MINHHKSRWLLKAVFLLTLTAFALPPHATAQDNAPPVSPGLVHREKIKAKLTSIIIDKVNFDKADIAVVLDFLSKKTKELDPEKEGINFVLRLPDAPAATDTGTTTPKIKTRREVSMTLDNIPLADLLNEISQQTNLQFTVEDYAVYLHPPN